MYIPSITTNQNARPEYQPVAAAPRSLTQKEREQPCRCKALVTRPSVSHLLQKAT
jgi:hypothetical protein